MRGNLHLQIVLLLNTFASSTMGLSLPGQSAITSKDVDAVGKMILDHYGDRRPREYSIVYTCQYLCGGWGDRLNGIVVTFYTALALDAHFAVQVEGPLPLPSIFPDTNRFAATKPCQAAQRINWIDKLKPRGLLAHSKEYARVFHKKGCYMIQANAAVWAEVVNNTALPWHPKLISALRPFDSISLYVLAYRLLLRRISGLLEPAYQDWEKRIPPQALHVGIQLRMGGKWHDAKRLLPACLPIVVRELLAKCASAKLIAVFATSDSQEALATVSKLLKDAAGNGTTITMHQTPGEILHIDRSMVHSQTSTTAQLKPYLDWVLLSKMEHLVVSRSGFGETAAWSSNVDFTIVDKAKCRVRRFSRTVARRRRVLAAERG